MHFDHEVFVVLDEKCMSFISFSIFLSSAFIELKKEAEVTLGRLQLKLGGLEHSF